jgi:hypothetical protein
VKNHIATTLQAIAVPVTISEKITRMKGVKSYYKYEFVGEGDIKAYTTSLDHTYNKVYRLKGEMEGLWEEEVLQEGSVM